MDLRQRLAGSDPPLLLDVRDPKEWQFCKIEGARHIPLGEIQDRLAELERGREIVVYCHHGIRSQKAAAFLQQQGFSRVANLSGGIDAWSREIDPAVPRY